LAIHPGQLFRHFPKNCLESCAPAVLTVISGNDFSFSGEDKRMAQDLKKEVDRLGEMTVSELRQRYAELFGEPTRTWHKDWLRKRVAWRIQALAEGDISERARRRAAELAYDADLRLSPPKESNGKSPEPGSPLTARIPPPKIDRRLPPRGTVLTRQYKGQSIQVRVLADGFEYEGNHFQSLSALAEAITGGHCNGYLFFRLTGRGR
jgi:hypothetical protein